MSTSRSRRPLGTSHLRRIRPHRGAAATVVLVLLLGSSAVACGGSDRADDGTVAEASSGPASSEAGDAGSGSTARQSSASTAASKPPGTTSAATPATTAKEAGAATETAPAGSRPGLFDFNQDGQKEATCGTADFKAGLVVRTYCTDLSGYANEPESGATLVPGALFSLPSPPDDPRDPPITSGASVSAQHFQGADGREIAVYTLSSDTVFATGSAELLDPAVDSLTAIANGLRASYPGASFQVRGHTDSTGSAAANQALSEQRSAAVAAFLVSAGIDATKMSSVGLGQSVPNYAETNQTGRDQNRRIEIVVRL